MKTVMTCDFSNCTKPSMYYSRNICKAHNALVKRRKNPEYTNWIFMKQRCYNKNTAYYKHYGGRGIKVCERWMGKDGYKNFITDMGKRPTLKHSIDRIDNDGDYTPSNCRWATRSIQTINQRTTTRNKSGIRGVYWNTKRRRWHAHISVNQKELCLGVHKDKSKAVKQRLEAEEKYYKPILESAV